MKLKQMVTIIAMLLVVIMAGCKKDEDPGKSSDVTSTDPANNATGVVLNKTISVLFSTPMDPKTITTQTFTVKNGSNPVPGVISYSGSTASFTPSDNFLPDVTYTATINTGVRNISGIPMGYNYVWKFTIGTMPIVISSSPANNATGVEFNKVVTVSFSAPMDPLTLTAETFLVKQGATSVAGTVSYNGTTASFTPSSDFMPNTVYTGTITTGAKNVPGIPLANNYVWTFSTSTIPSVISSDPANNATDVILTKVVTASFSAPMDPLTLTAATFTVKQGATSVAGTVTYTGTTASFTPSSELMPSTTYTGTITTGAKNVSGIPIANNYIWTFNTGAIPSVISSDPANIATDISLTKVVTASFSVPMDPLTLTAATFTLKQGETSVAGTVTYTGTTASFTPSSALMPNTTYTGTITTGAKNVPGIPLANNYVWTFSTSTIPTVTSSDPANNATNVLITKVVTASFSAPMDPLTLTGTTFTVKQGATSVAGTVSYAGTTVSFTPSNNLVPGTMYTCTITTGAKNIPGVPLAGNYVWIFTTESSVIDEVQSTNPVDLAIGIALNRVLTAEFSEAMDPLTITTSTFILSTGGNPVAGTVTYSGTTATFTPLVNLLPNTFYTATITTGVKNAQGISLPSNKVWSFTTVSSQSQQAIVDLGAAGNYVILAKTAITNIAISAITGDLGLSPAATTYISGLALTDATGYATSAQVTGKIYAADMAVPVPINLTTAVDNMITAYTDAAGRQTPDFLELGTGNIGGKTLTPGLYKWTSTISLPSNVTISGNSTDVWIFQTTGDLLVSNSVSVILSGGALPQNIFWQVAGQATFGVNSHFEGIILSMTGITFQTGASFKGRALAQTAVILDGNAITKP